MENNIEFWKDVLGYEGLYQISNLGNIKSLNFNGTKKEGLLKLSLDDKGYQQIALYLNKKRKMFRVHQLVAITFLKHVKDGFNIIVDHIDNNPLNNNVKNLQLITQRENTSKDKTKYSSKYTGVFWIKRDKKWASQISLNGKSTHLGVFNSEIEASNAYKSALSKI